MKLVAQSISRLFGVAESGTKNIVAVGDSASASTLPRSEAEAETSLPG
jgi:hypothetical protein